MSAQLSAAGADNNEARLARQEAECERDHLSHQLAACERRAQGLAALADEAQRDAAGARAGAAATEARLEAAGVKLVWRQRLLAEVQRRGGGGWGQGTDPQGCQGSARGLMLHAIARSESRRKGSPGIACTCVRLRARGRLQPQLGSSARTPWLHLLGPLLCQIVLSMLHVLACTLALHRI